MYTLYHFPLCPFSRKLRVVMGEKRVQFDLKYQEFWHKNLEFFKLTPFASVPVLARSGRASICNSYLAIKYLERAYVNFELIPDDFNKALSTETMAMWFDERFFNDVVYHFLYQKVINVLDSGLSPSMPILNAAKNNMMNYFDYIEGILHKTRYLACDVLTVADITAACHISVLDYLNVIDWNKMPIAIKDWYAVIKCRSSFRPLLNDRISILNPPAHYANLDF